MKLPPYPSQFCSYISSNDRFLTCVIHQALTSLPTYLCSCCSHIQEWRLRFLTLLHPENSPSPISKELAWWWATAPPPQHRLHSHPTSSQSILSMSLQCCVRQCVDLTYSLRIPSASCTAWNIKGAQQVFFPFINKT